MRLILQRVRSASVRVGGETIASIGYGLLVLVGVERGDAPEVADRAAAKLASLRLFDDDSGRMNLDAAGSLRKGRRPSFDRAAPGEEAEPTVDRLAESLRRAGFEVDTGRFGARMEVELVNDGPVTFVLEIRDAPLERD